MSLYVLGETAQLQLTTYNAAGVATDAGAVTLEITNPDSTVVTSTTPAHVASSGVYTFPWPPTMLGRSKVAWTATGANATADVHTVDVYGATIATPGDLRSRYPDVADTAKYPDAKVREKLRAAVDQWNKLARVSMAPFGARRTWIGDGRSTRALPDCEIRRVVALTIDGAATTAFTCSEAGTLDLTSGIFTTGKTVVCYYEHGLDDPPGPVVDAVLQRTVELLVPPQSGLGRMTSVANDLGYARLSLAGRDGSTGVPDFDSTAALYGRSAMGFA